MIDDNSPGVGSRAPEFTAPLTTPDGAVEETALSSLLSESAVLLVFQPTDFELESFSERHALGEYDWFNTDDRLQVVAVNHARPETNQRFADYLDVTYPFFSDRTSSIAASYGVTYRALGFAPRPKQACFFIDTEGVVQYQWVADDSPNDRVAPRLHDLYEVVADVLGRPRESKTFGFTQIRG